MTSLLLVGFGSALGGMARYGMGLVVRTSSGFPWSTLAVNVLGSFALGVLSGCLARFGSADGGWTPLVRAFAVIGLCGGFTTFSTFSNDAFRMIENAQWSWATAYVLASLGGGLFAVFLGYWISR